MEGYFDGLVENFNEHGHCFNGETNTYYWDDSIIQDGFGVNWLTELTYLWHAVLFQNPASDHFHEKDRIIYKFILLSNCDGDG